MAALSWRFAGAAMAVWNCGGWSWNGTNASSVVVSTSERGSIPIASPDLDAGACGERMSGGDGEHDRLARERRECDAGRSASGERDERQVQASLEYFTGHLLRAADVADLHLDRGMLAAERSEHSCEIDRAHPLGLHRAEHDRPAQATEGLVDGISCRVRRG